MQHFINKMCGLLSEASEPKANRRLLPPAREGRLACGQWDNYRTNSSRLHFVTSSLPSFIILLSFVSGRANLLVLSNLPRRQKNGILCVLCVNAASFRAKTAYFLAALTRNRTSSVFWLSTRQSDRKILEGSLCPRHRDDEQRHTSPGAAGVFEGAAPPVLMVRGC